MDNPIYEERYGKLDAEAYRGNRIESVILTLKAFRGDRLLDIGCGDGALTEIIAKTLGAREVKGVDVSGNGLNLARQRGIECVQFNTDADAPFPYPENYFDFVFCGEVIEHVFDPDKLLEFAYRALRPGGKMMITTPNLASWHSRIYLALGYNPMCCSVSLTNHHAGKPFGFSTGSGMGHIRFFTYRALRDLLLDHRFLVRKSLGFCSVPEKSDSSLLLRLVALADRLFCLSPSLANQIGILCEKP